MPQKCQGLRKYGHDLAAEDPHFLGGFAEYCYILPGTWILKLPPDLGDEEATPLNCGVATMASVTEAAEIGLGDAVVVQGLGLLGLYGAAMAKARGALSASMLCATGWRSPKNLASIMPSISHAVARIPS
jgi:D-arabinose 1-dehydrogenase-like Zn-dependent alcohol dehydrogenase